MPSEMRIAGVVGEPGFAGLDKPDIHVAEGVIEVAGIKDGMSSGKPSLALSFRLPSGESVLFEVPWRLFSFTHKYFEERFGAPDMAGMDMVFDASSGQGGKSRVKILPDEEAAAAFFECELCGERREASDFEGTDEERQAQMLQWWYRHFREKHPDWTPPKS